MYGILVKLFGSFMKPQTVENWYRSDIISVDSNNLSLQLSDTEIVI